MAGRYISHADDFYRPILSSFTASTAMSHSPDSSKGAEVLTTSDARDLTENESTQLYAFKEALEDNEDAFTAGDTISSTAMDFNKHPFFYVSEGTIHRTSLPFNDATAEQVFAVSKIAPFGKGSETVIDESYRCARELHVSRVYSRPRHCADLQTPDFSLSCAPLELSGALEKIRRQLEISQPLVATLLKANVYGPGGFFKPHREYVLSFTSPRSSK